MTTIFKNISVKTRIICQVLRFPYFPELQYKQKKVIILTLLLKMGLDDTHLKENNAERTEEKAWQRYKNQMP